MLEDNKRKSLGRGLGALLGEDALLLTEETPTKENVSGENVKMVPIKLLYASKYQPRSEFNQEALDALTVSIKEKGVLQPLLVRAKNNGKFEIIAGERRVRAACQAGLFEIPVIVKDMADKEVLEVALVENLLRENLSAIEEAEGLQRLINEFSHTQEALSSVIGKSRSYIANTLRLLTLPASVQQMIRDNKLTAGHARPLVGLEQAEALAKKIVDKGLSVREVEQLVQKSKETKTKTKKKTNSDVADIEKSLKQSLGFNVKISSSANGSGKVILPYADLSELDRIIDMLSNKKAG